MTLYEEISNYLQQGRAPKVQELVKKAVEEGCDAHEILDEALLKGINIIGEKFKNEEVYVPEVLIAARAMNKGIDVIRPLLVAEGVEEKGTVVIGTVKGDIHDIGKNLVRMLMEGKGLKVIDLGTDVPAEDFVKAAIENNAQVISCSALLTTTMGEMKNVADAVKAAGLSDKIKVMVGGAPVNQKFADSCGVDCYTEDATSAAAAALAFCTQA